jgi:hypothetical protein
MPRHGEEITTTLGRFCVSPVFDKADKMGVRVATNDRALINNYGLKEQLTLKAYQTPRAFEYVDTLGGPQTAGDYSIEHAVVLTRKRPKTAS